MTQEAKLQFVIERLEKNIPFDIITVELNSYLAEIKSDMVVTENELRKIFNSHIHDEVHSLNSKSMTQSINYISMYKYPKISKKVLRESYQAYLLSVTNDKSKSDSIKENNRIVHRFGVNKPSSDYAAIATQSDIEGDRIRISNTAVRDKLTRYSNELIGIKSYEEVAAHLHKLIVECGIDYVSPRNYNVPHLDNKQNASMIGIWSDFHVGEVIKPSSLVGMNEYDVAIAYGRFTEIVDITVQKYIDYSKFYNVDCIYIDILGDMFSGNIHAELMASNEELVGVLCLMTAMVMSQGITTILKYVPKVVVSGSYGNHSRKTDKKGYKTHVDNYDYMLLQTISAFFTTEIKQERIKFNIERSEMHLQKRRGFQFLLEHGDNYSGLANVINEFKNRRLSLAENGFQLPDYFEIGHFHSETEFSSYGIYVNGSLKGTDEYVANAWKKTSRPSQKLMVLTDQGIQEVVNIYASKNPVKSYAFDFEHNPVIGEMYVKYSGDK